MPSEHRSRTVRRPQRKKQRTIDTSGKPGGTVVHIL